MTSCDHFQAGGCPFKYPGDLPEFTDEEVRD